jgi:hypothetical protein
MTFDFSLPCDVAFAMLIAVMASYQIAPNSRTFKNMVAFIDAHCCEVSAVEFFAQLERSLAAGLRSRRAVAARWERRYVRAS